MCFSNHIPVSSATSQTITSSNYSPCYASTRNITGLNALLSLTCFLKLTPALNHICQISDCIANSSSAVSAQKLPVDDALLS